MQAVRHAYADFNEGRDQKWTGLKSSMIKKGSESGGRGRGGADTGARAPEAFWGRMKMMLRMLDRNVDEELPAQLIFSVGADLIELIFEYQDLEMPLEKEKQRLLNEKLAVAQGVAERKMLGYSAEEALACRAYQNTEERRVVAEIFEIQDALPVGDELGEAHVDRLFAEVIVSTQQRRNDGADAAKETKSVTAMQLHALLRRPASECASVSHFMQKELRRQLNKLHEGLVAAMTADTGIEPPQQLALAAQKIWEKVEADKEKAYAASEAARQATLDGSVTLLLKLQKPHDKAACEAVKQYIVEDDRKELAKLLLARDARAKTAPECAAAAEAIYAAAKAGKEKAEAALKKTRRESVSARLGQASASADSSPSNAELSVMDAAAVLLLPEVKTLTLERSKGDQGTGFVNVHTVGRRKKESYCIRMQIKGKMRRIGGMEFRSAEAAALVLARFQQERKESDWVACDLCKKWRTVPPAFAKAIGEQHWECASHPDRQRADLGCEGALNEVEALEQEEEAPKRRSDDTPANKVVKSGSKKKARAVADAENAGANVGGRGGA